MAVEWTKEQRQVIELRDRNILVSAAAGSGKTAVLVERIIKRITDEQHPVDVDRLLVVTFTNAAASEMRERIGDAIEAALEREPENHHLQRQQSLIHNAQITTIDSFCLYIVRNYCHTIDLEPGFRIADEGELALLKEQVLDEVLESFYEKSNEDFTSFMEAFATAKSDRNVRSMILELFTTAQSNPWQSEWLDKLDEDYKKACESPDDSVWMQLALSDYRNSMEDVLRELQKAWNLTQEFDGPQMYVGAIKNDLELVETLCTKDTYADIVQALTELPAYARLAAARGYDGSLQKQAQVKAAREQMKDTIQKLREKIFFQSQSDLKASLCRQQPMVHVLLELVRAFTEAYDKAKRKKSLVDFSDIEHFALDILVNAKTKEPTPVAEEFRNFFEEVMIDEYQDSNYLQEAILSAVSKVQSGEPNMFMVGDVKQSIYRFRLARPELFMEKYETYTKEDSPYQKIELHKNFRSREGVLAAVNDIFYKIMGKDLGRVRYDEDAALYPGADYPALKGEQESSEVIVVEQDSSTERSILEAGTIGRKIRQLKENGWITDKKSGELRRPGYSDMVILLRSPGGDADVMAAELGKMGIPAHAISRTGYFSTQEIQVLLNYLAILDNPRQDIPLASVLTSWFGGLGEEELGYLRAVDKEKPFYENVLAWMPESEEISESISEELRQKLPEEIQEKLARFHQTYQKLRKKSRYLPIHELLYEIFAMTGYLDYVTALPAGGQRRANVEMLIEKAIAFENSSYRGLFHFIRYIEKLQKYDVDFGEAEIVSENDEAVRIMSIHKSKGLEFPICFVAGLGKRFNMSDSYGKIVVHPQFGIGVEEYDTKRRIKSQSFVKQILAEQIRLENLGEELRVLYVALTRAKEKLILVGTLKKPGEKLESYQSSAGTGMLSYGCRSNAGSYFDWILPAIYSYGERYPVYVDSDSKEQSEFAEEFQKGWEKEQLLEHIREADTKELTERLSYCYPKMEEVSLKTKISVSELKHRDMVFEPEEEQTVRWFEEEVPLPYVPEFVKAREENQGAKRGTAVHRAMECIDFSRMEEQIQSAGVQTDRAGIAGIVKKRLSELLEEHKIDEQMYELILPDKIAGFFMDETAIRMSNAQRAGRLFLEKPFVLGKEAGEIYPEMESTERVLIQGIVDVFFIEDGKVHVLDYKTDRVNKGEQLIGRYKTQIELYAEALAKALEVEVGEKLIYSFALEKIVKL